MIILVGASYGFSLLQAMEFGHPRYMPPEVAAAKAKMEAAEKEAIEEAEEMEIEEPEKTEEVEIKEPKYWTIINDTGRDIYMRIRAGEVGPDTEKIMPPEPIASQLMINPETFKLPKESTVSIDLNSLQKWPLRFRIWKTTYTPKEDIDPETGKPLDTSEENRKNSWLSLLLEDMNAIVTFKGYFPYLVLVTLWNGGLGVRSLQQGEEWKPGRYFKAAALKPRGYIKTKYIRASEVGEIFKSEQ